MEKNYLSMEDMAKVLKKELVEYYSDFNVIDDLNLLGKSVGTAHQFWPWDKTSLGQFEHYSGLPKLFERSSLAFSAFLTIFWTFCQFVLRLVLVLELSVYFWTDH